MTEQARLDKGIPAGGQFAAKAKSDDVVTLTAEQGAEKKNADWHEAAASLVEGGRTPEAARCAVTLVLANQMAQTYLANTQRSLAAGRETDAAMFTIAFAAMRDMPQRMFEFAEDQAAVRAVATETRKRLSGSGALLDMVHPSGRQPIFKAADDVLADFESFLAPEPATTEGQS